VSSTIATGKSRLNVDTIAVGLSVNEVQEQRKAGLGILQAGPIARQQAIHVDETCCCWGVQSEDEALLEIDAVTNARHKNNAMYCLNLHDSLICLSYAIVPLLNRYHPAAGFFWGDIC